MPENFRVEFWEQERTNLCRGLWPSTAILGSHSKGAWRSPHYPCVFSLFPFASPPLSTSTIPPPSPTAS